MSLSDKIITSLHYNDAMPHFIFVKEIKQAVKELNITLQNWKVIPDYQLLRDKIDKIFGGKLK